LKKYLLDTDISAFVLRGVAPLAERIIAEGEENCYISEITVAELMFGSENSHNPEKTDEW